VGAENEPLSVLFEKTQLQTIKGIDGVYNRMLRTVQSKRIVMPVNEGDAVLAQQGIHGGSLQCIDADGDEALP
jgi:hypothetical protein